MSHQPDTVRNVEPQLKPRSAIALLFGARAARGLADGFATIILPAYLVELGYSPFQIGVVATGALLGTAILTLGVGWLGVHRDLRTLLLLSALTMMLTGLAFPFAEAFPVILLLAFVGTINPSPGDIGLFVPLEHAFLAGDTSDQKRTQIFARYSLIGGLSTAAGALAATVPDFLVSFDVPRLVALKSMFFVYTALGLIGAVLYRLLPESSQTIDERPKASALGPSRRIVYRLAALFSVDAFAGGFAVQSLVALWLFERFDLSLSSASLFFFWSNTLSAFSYPLAARLSRRFGLVNTMVFTHIPSSFCLIAAALIPNLMIVLVLLSIRAALSQMDVPTRTSYVMAVVTPEERPAAASVTAVPRSLASAISPSVAGAMLGTAFSGLPLVICGALKIAYDITLLLSFRHIKPPEEAEGTVEQAAGRTGRFGSAHHRRVG
ncbi:MULTISPECIES: MFS transporter [unclassified Bradyrhizobium]|uniref:MFS transporter n=1 Tax=unclassified Bradyrhizobium TaxID=2631580 RepID=UPI00247AB99C|nr:MULTISPECIES: MFS transporter [unclassified Bradyrhizobium]WGR73916.1 MFS transporter [Bradyrhizobium sp. ISRA426]WGR78753.1 MFS transporter [Bradyrhizobium sp. ISRA430]WGR89155.1 MFS transporter [Bradyrhizobium sp. ISRA432]